VHELENAVGVQFVQGNVESFDLVTQELYRHLLATIHTQSETEKLRTESACTTEIKTERRENETGGASGAGTDTFSR
jgi:hypothetical protein